MAKELILGRNREKEILQSCYESKESQLLIVSGRRRIGKSFLINQYFDNLFAFKLVGDKKLKKNEQLFNFREELKRKTNKDNFLTPKDWLSAFSLLRDYIDILDTLKKKIPNTAIIMTVGENGSYYQNENNRFHQDIVKCKAEDTTAAGDTFIGFFVSSQIKGYSIEKSMEYAAKASSLAVSKKGAMSSVPFANEVF